MDNFTSPTQTASRSWSLAPAPRRSLYPSSSMVDRYRQTMENHIQGMAYASAAMAAANRINEARTVAAAAGCVPASQLVADNDGVLRADYEVCGEDGELVLFPVEPCDDDAPEEIELYTTGKTISKERFEALSTTIEDDLAALEALEAAGEKLRRARANYALLQRERTRLARVLVSMRRAGQNPEHIRREIQKVNGRINDLALEWWPVDLAA